MLTQLLSVLHLEHNKLLCVDHPYSATSRLSHYVILNFKNRREILVLLIRTSKEVKRYLILPLYPMSLSMAPSIGIYDARLTDSDIVRLIFLLGNMGELSFVSTIPIVIGKSLINRFEVDTDTSN